MRAAPTVALDPTLFTSAFSVSLLFFKPLNIILPLITFFSAFQYLWSATSFHVLPHLYKSPPKRTLKNRMFPGFTVRDLQYFGYCDYQSVNIEKMLQQNPKGRK